jgi:hypothetical protein
MKKLVLAVAVLFAFLNVAGHGGGKENEEPVTVQEQLHQPHAVRVKGKCGDRDCGSSKCTGPKGDTKNCGDTKSCPLGHCISKERSCCCRRASPESQFPATETTPLGTVAAHPVRAAETVFPNGEQEGIGSNNCCGGKACCCARGLKKPAQKADRAR